ncbi:MAG: MBL fold metallo-hydrolase [Proteobacteria bacterium]|nr:MBL fold metallo-hydrolase [Pseudomonadota bacterium]
MQITRRAFTSGGLMLGGLALGQGLVRPARASAQLGAMQIDMVSDGNLVLPRDFITGPMPADEVAAILTRNGVTGEALTPPCNITLLRHEDRVILFDVGSGSDFQPSAGLLPETLDSLGLAPEDITHLVITHGHPDHIWGLLDDFDEPFLPQAQILMGQAEFDYWMDPGTLDSIGAARQAFAIGAQRRLEAVADLVTFFEDGAEILPGVAARLTPGHTPGHMSFELRDGSESLMVLGDAIGNHHVAFERPQWESGSDQDPATAAATRVALFDQLASAQMPIAGFHLPGGLGRVEAHAEGGYRFLPA